MCSHIYIYDTGTHQEQSFDGEAAEPGRPQGECSPWRRASAGITFLRHKPSNPESIERPGAAPGGGEQAVGGTAHMRTQPSTHCQETLACFLPPYLWFNLHPMFRKQNSEFTKSIFQIYLFLFMYLPVCLCEHVCTTCRQTLRGQKRA